MAAAALTGQATHVLTACGPPSSRPATGLRPADRHHGLRQTPRLILHEPGCRRGGLARLLPLRMPAFGRGAVAQGPRPSSVMTADHRGDAFRRSPTCRTSAGAGYCVPAGQNQARAPPCMRWRGPCPASPHRRASCPALPAPRAARRGQVPVRETGLPAPPTFPGSPPGGARFRTVRTFLLPRRAPRKSPLPAISGFPAIHELIHRKPVVIRIRRRLSTGLFTTYPQAPGCSRRTPEPLSPNALG